MEEFDVLVVGGGPAGLAAAVACSDMNLKTLIIEREEKLGGILKQCIHDGFGLITFKEKLTGPEYAERYIALIKEKNITVYTDTFLVEGEKNKEDFYLTLTSSQSSLFKVKGKALILATGCRERTARQVFISGTRPAGIYTAGLAQHFTNIEGYLPCKKCVVLGSGDIGLIMARRLTLEGAEVLGVYEAKSTPSGLQRNIVQCLEDFNIPLYLSHTVTKVFGESRLEAVEIAKVDEKMAPIKGTERKILCDGLILSVGLIPENEVAEGFRVNIDPKTKGPIVDENFMTSEPGVFSCGNSLHVNDLVDYVSESGVNTARGVKNYLDNKKKPSYASIEFPQEDFLYIVPQRININNLQEKAVLYFRVREEISNAKVSVFIDQVEVLSKKYSYLRPAELEKLVLNLKNINLSVESKIKFSLIKG